LDGLLVLVFLGAGYGIVCQDTCFEKEILHVCLSFEGFFLFT
jgi:hypothetical protein